MILHYGFHLPQRLMKDILQKEFSEDNAFTNLIAKTEYSEKYGIYLHVTGTVKLWSDVERLWERYWEIKKQHFIGRFTTTNFHIISLEAPPKGSKWDWLVPEKDGTYVVGWLAHAMDSEHPKDANPNPETPKYEKKDKSTDTDQDKK